MSLSLNCDHCSKSLSKINWCKSCKKAAYCDRLCQRKHWKSHRPKCTFDFIKQSDIAQKIRFGNKKKTKSANNSIPIHPFFSIPLCLFTKKTFIAFLCDCNHKILPVFAKIIYCILTGYQFSIDLSNKFPSKVISSMYGKHKIESFLDDIVNPPINLQNYTYFQLTDHQQFVDKIGEESENGCSECTICLNEIEQIIDAYHEDIEKEDINNIDDEIKKKAYSKYLCSVFTLKIPKHLKYRWESFPIYVLQYIRDTNDDSIGIVMQTSHSKGHIITSRDTWSLAMFKCNDIMPYFNGIHYAYLLKIILDHYDFNEKYYHQIETVGFSWSITNDIKLRTEFLDNIRKIFHCDIQVTDDYFTKRIYLDHPMYDGIQR